MDKEEKIFDRSVCCMFFESYLEGAEKIANVFDKEFAFDYLTAVIRYALYREESENPKINAIVSPLKDTIDANQNKRAAGYNGENIELTEAIIKYKTEHPNATQREIKKAVGCSIGKVNKVLSSNFNSNKNSNSTSNLNSVNVNMNKVQEGSLEEVLKEDVDTSERIEKKRILLDLRDEELDSLLNDFEYRVRYSELYKKYQLEERILTKELPNQIAKIKEERKKKKEKNNSIKLREDMACEFVNYPEKREKLSKYFDCAEDEVISILIELERSADTVIEFYENELLDDGNSYFEKKLYAKKLKDTSMSTYLEFMKSTLDFNNYEKYKVS